MRVVKLAPPLLPRLPRFVRPRDAGRLPATGTLSCRAFPNGVMAVAVDLIKLRKPQVDFVQQRGGFSIEAPVCGDLKRHLRVQPIRAFSQFSN
jgi:hypothetical protein